MRQYRLPLHAFATTCLLAALVVPGQAKVRPKTDPPAVSKTVVALPKIRIENFGEISPTYYRGAQPAARDYKDLASLGIKTVIDLTREGRADEPGLVAKAGMQFFRIPLVTTERPSDAAVEEFLRLVDDPANLPVFV